MLTPMLADDLAEELRLARRELKFVRMEHERMAEQLQRLRRQRARLHEQADVVSAVLAARLTEAYWSSAEGARASRFSLRGRPARVGPPAEELRMVREVESSPLFDPGWYLRRHLDAARAGLSAAVHYVRTGGPTGEDPSEHFDTTRFLQRNPAARTSGLPPLVYHVRHPDPVLVDAAR